MSEEELDLTSSVSEGEYNDKKRRTISKSFAIAQSSGSSSGSSKNT